MVGGAVLDTDVFSALFVTPRPPGGEANHVNQWRESLAGIRVAIAFQTRAELLEGARSGGWREKRMTKLADLISATPVLGVDEDVLQAYVALTADCRAAGHALHAKIHTADRWIASCAIAKDVPLLSGDGIFEGAPGLTLLGVAGS